MNNSGQILLTGGGTAEESSLIDTHLVSTLHERGQNKIAYIPVAKPKSEFKGCKDWFKSVFGKTLGIEIWTDLSNISKHQINEVGALYLGGGDTFKLAKELSHYNFRKRLTDFLHDGKIVYGGSAGAIVLGKSLKTASNYGEHQKLITGLNILGGYSILCHYRREKNMRKLAQSIVRNTNSVILAIPNRSAIILNNGKLKVIGYEPAELIESNKVTTLKL